MSESGQLELDRNCFLPLAVLNTLSFTSLPRNFRVGALSRRLSTKVSTCELAIVSAGLADLDLRVDALVARFKEIFKNTGDE